MISHLVHDIAVEQHKVGQRTDFNRSKVALVESSVGCVSGEAAEGFIPGAAGRALPKIRNECGNDHGEPHTERASELGTSRRLVSW